MLNIISKSLVSNRVSGPKKVVDNLIKGLDKLGYPYVINQRLDSCKRLWIHDDLEALMSSQGINDEVKIIAGPNIFILPRNIPENINLSKTVYIHPSEWVVDFWKYLGFERCKLDAWPTGIDTEAHLASNRKRNKVLIYFKNRFPEELQKAEEVLQRSSIEYEIITYGEYKHSDYVKTLADTTYILWIGRQESQGIALEEALAMDVPILVWDVEKVGHWIASPKEMEVFNKKENEYPHATSAYYFDKNCGVIIKDANKLEENILYMKDHWKEFSPRKYILENLSLEKQARDFINLYQKHFGISYEEGLIEKQNKKGPWKNRKLTFTILTKVKDLIKSFLAYMRSFKR